jgi:hypothetical protein
MDNFKKSAVVSLPEAASASEANEIRNLAPQSQLTKLIMKQN